MTGRGTGGRTGGATIRLDVPLAARGERLDRFLAAELDLPRNRVQRWIRDGLVTIGDETAKASTVLSQGDEIACSPPPVTIDESVVPEAGPLAIVHEDEEIVVVDKPSRMAVHPGAGRESGTLANRLVAAYPEMARVGGPGRPGIVHRLDIDTTGLVVIARTDAAYRRLSEAFAARRVEKTYLAICYGAPDPTPGVYDWPIGRHPKRRKEMTVRDDGRSARTTWARLGSHGGASLVRIGLETGRTHQIRVHFKAAAHPLVGDPVYGEARWKGLRGRERALLRDFPRPALHAWRLGFDHPGSGEPLELQAPPPADLADLWRALSGGEIGDLLS